MGRCFLRFKVCIEGWAESQGSLGKEILLTLHGLVLSEGFVVCSRFVGSSVIGLHDSLEVESFLGLQGFLGREGWARIGKRAKCSGQVTTVSAGSACFAKISSSSKLTASACEWPVVFGCIEELPFAPDLRLLCG